MKAVFLLIVLPMTVITGIVGVIEYAKVCYQQDVYRRNGIELSKMEIMLECKPPVIVVKEGK